MKPYMTWKMGVSFGIAWLITNGWSWLFLAIGPALDLDWMTKIGAAYQIILWMPFTVEKILTFAIGVWLHKLLFKTDPKQLNT